MFLTSLEEKPHYSENGFHLIRVTVQVMYSWYSTFSHIGITNFPGYFQHQLGYKFVTKLRQVLAFLFKAMSSTTLFKYTLYYIMNFKKWHSWYVLSKTKLENPINHSVVGNNRSYIMYIIELTDPSGLPHSQTERQVHPATTGVFTNQPPATHISPNCVRDIDQVLRTHSYSPPTMTPIPTYMYIYILI